MPITPLDRPVIKFSAMNKRETSFEGLVSQLENGEDGIYNLMTDNKQAIF